MSSLLVLAGCTQQAKNDWQVVSPSKWQYGVSVGEIDLNHDGKFDALGCGTDGGPFLTLQDAKNFVESSCSNSKSKQEHIQ